MPYYSAVLFFIVVVSLVAHRKKVTISDKILYFYVFMALFILSAIRKDVGMDYEAYSEMYSNSYSFNDGIKEYGLRYIFMACHRLGISFEFIVAFFSFFTLWNAFKFIQRYSVNIIFSVLVFYAVGQFYLNTFNVMRQCLVIYLVLSNLNLIINRKFFKYFSLLIACSLFIHKSALFLLLLYLANVHIGKYWKLLFILVSVLFSQFLILVVNNTPYAMYLQFDRFISDLGLTTYLLLFFTILIFVQDLFTDVKTRQENLFFNINYILLILYIISIIFMESPVKILIIRLTYYLSPILVILIPNLAYTLEKKKIYVTPFLYLFFIVLFMLSLDMNGEANHLLPYKTII